jgi:glycosyltransferase involved in cell wall biosynthesis
MTPDGYSDRAIELFRSTPNIEYRGQVSPEDAVRLMGESLILLSTSDEEGFPQTFLEAWSLGTPVVTLGIDPDRAIQTHGLGAVCEDVASAATAVTKLASDTVAWGKASEAARRYVTRTHGPDAAVSAVSLAVRGAVRSAGDSKTRPLPSADLV